MKMKMVPAHLLTPIPLMLAAYGIDVVLDMVLAMALYMLLEKTGSIHDVWVPVELQCIYEGSLKGNRSLLNA